MYRDNALPDPVTVCTFELVTARGTVMFALLAVLAIVAAIAAFILVVVDTSPKSADWVGPSTWVTIAVAIGSAIGAVKIYRSQSRQLVITRIGNRHVLAISSNNIELELPLRMSGRDYEEPSVPISLRPDRHRSLKLADARGRELMLHEVHGYNSAPWGSHWFDELDGDTPAVSFETSDSIVRIRDSILALDAQTR
jgi:hypothetical protein